MCKYKIGDTVSWKQKRSRRSGMIIEVLKDRILSEGAIGDPDDTAFIIQEKSGYKLLMLESELF